MPHCRRDASQIALPANKPTGRWTRDYVVARATCYCYYYFFFCIWCVCLCVEQSPCVRFCKLMKWSGSQMELVLRMMSPWTLVGKLLVPIPKTQKIIASSVASSRLSSIPDSTVARAKISRTGPACLRELLVEPEQPTNLIHHPMRLPGRMRCYESSWRATFGLLPSLVFLFPFL